MPKIKNAHMTVSVKNGEFIPKDILYKYEAKLYRWAKCNQKKIVEFFVAEDEIELTRIGDEFRASVGKRVLLQNKDKTWQLWRKFNLIWEEE